MSDWVVICARRLDPGDPARVTHLGVDVPRGTQHVPVEEALAAMAAGRHRFFVDRDGDRLLLRELGDGGGLTVAIDPPGEEVLADLPDCGDGVRFEP